MDRLFRIPVAYLSLHPLARANHELTLSPLQPNQVEYCRYHEPSGRSIHLYTDSTSNSIVMAISRSHPPGGPVWRLYIYIDLWLSGTLQRTAEGIEPLFEFHPLGWGSDAHQAMMDTWGMENGVKVSAIPGLSRHLFLW